MTKCEDSQGCTFRGITACAGSMQTIGVETLITWMASAQAHSRGLKGSIQEISSLGEKIAGPDSQFGTQGSHRFVGKEALSNEMGEVEKAIWP